MIYRSEIEGYIRLSAAIIASGVHDNDKSFLKSDWCAFLKGYVGEWLTKTPVRLGGVIGTHVVV